MAQPMKIFCRGDTNLNVAISGTMVVLAPANNGDDLQLWFQDYSVAEKLTDDEGRRPFALVNKATRQALVNKNIKTNDLVRVQLAPYRSFERVDLSMLWTLGDTDFNEGFREVRAFRDITQTLNGLGGNSNGTVVGVYPSTPEAANAVWKLETVNQ